MFRSRTEENRFRSRECENNRVPVFIPTYRIRDHVWDVGIDLRLVYVDCTLIVYKRSLKLLKVRDRHGSSSHY
ncbi:hypothetical protein EPI10_020381 [Gossypium australe]|uniref:Uncharacterized protein n=1 Tax=Gossypium australe TaxID=47621 RepID=A0A5B6WF31_9ROSI|nr:hypothetical protein EPI10_020381 [Gossypium australe]